MPAPLGYNAIFAIEANSSLFPTIDKLLKTICKRPHLAVVMGMRQNDGTFTEVYTHYFGEPAMWQFPFGDIAYAKAELTAKHNMGSREIHLMHPELLEVGATGEPGDVKYWGSAIVGNLVVACSGVEPYFDETFSNMIVYLWRGLIQHALDDPVYGKRRGDDSFF